MMDYISNYQSPAGAITIACDGTSITGLWFDGAKYFADTLAPEYEERETPVLREARAWLDCYFGGGIPDFTPPVQLNGTPFRMAVWVVLKGIPYGGTMTYGEIARILAEQNGSGKMSARAVGGAVGRNPISIIVPCHRVIGSGGSLTGFAGGVDKKIKLLTIEKVNLQHMFIPQKGTAL